MHRKDDERKVKFAWSMPNECNYVYRSCSERDRKWSPNKPNNRPNGIASDSHRTASWKTVTEWHHETRLNMRIIGSPLPKAPTGMFTKRLTELDVKRPYWRAIRLLGRCWRSLNTTTDVHHVRATGCKRWCHISRTAYKAMHEGLESANAFENICGMNDHFMRSLQDRYDVIYDWPSPTAMIPRAEATIHAEKSSPLHPCRLSANMATEAASKAVTMITNGLGLLSCPRGTDVHKPAGIYMVSMTGYWNAYS